MERYKKIALASTFSPRFLPLLAEAGRLAEKLNCEFSLIHAGEESREGTEKFEAAFRDLGLSRWPPIYWVRGDDPATAILQAIKEQGIDLLVAGALEKEASGRHYVGNVARTLLRDAPCSLMLFTRPSVDPQPFREIVVITDFSELSTMALQRSHFLARHNSAERIRVVRVFTIFTQAKEQPAEFFGGADSRKPMLAGEERHILAFAEAAGKSPVPLEAVCVEGTTGFAASDYVEGVKADLLVIPSKPVGATQLLPDGMDWVFSVIPSNLFIVR